MLDPEAVDFKKLGFRAGIEVHHQIRSDRKPFCRCPPNLERAPENMDYSFHHYFRPVLGEIGDFDPGMPVEFEEGFKVIHYAQAQHMQISIAGKITEREGPEASYSYKASNPESILY